MDYATFLSKSAHKSILTLITVHLEQIDKKDDGCLSEKEN